MQSIQYPLMKTFYPRKKLPSAAAIEVASQKILIEKMGLTQEEFEEVNVFYGVSAAKLLELMQLSRYQFILSDKIAGQCEPCKMVVSKGQFLNI